MKPTGLTASVVLAAGRGSRMGPYPGNKTLLPLLPDGPSPWEGERPMLLHILSRLPPGPKAVVVHHREEDVMAATQDLDCIYCRQSVINGTGGALLASRRFLETVDCRHVVIAMGDVPLVRRSTYLALLDRLEARHFVVLGFRPPSRDRYGILETCGDRVTRITEWASWRNYPQERRNAPHICNSGIYAARREVLITYVPELASHPHRVEKEVDGQPTAVEEFFLTDVVALMHRDGLSVGYLVAENPEEVMGVDDLAALREAQRVFRGLQP